MWLGARQYTVEPATLLLTRRKGAECAEINLSSVVYNVKGGRGKQERGVKRVWVGVENGGGHFTEEQVLLVSEHLQGTNTVRIEGRAPAASSGLCTKQET